jgi:uncharacterized protein (DUF3820 family)
MTDNTIITFGKHRGKKLVDVPANWLLYAWDNFDRHGNREELMDYIEDNLDVIEKEYHENQEKELVELFKRYPHED